MIAPAKLSELEEILALTRACGKHMRDNGIDQWDENYPDIDSLKNDLETQTLFAYYEEGKVLGIVVLNEKQDEEYMEINWSTTEDQHNIVVHRLAVLPDHQGKGIARKLMDFSEEYAKKNGYDAIRLDTFSQNPRNQRFYEKRNYDKLGKVYLKYKKEHPYYCYEMLLNE
jgi:ribosomal protein S18 acetylase RimI-like enzyme